MRRAAILLAMMSCLACARDGLADPAGTVPECQFCNWPTGWRGELEAGPGWVSDDSLAFGSFRGLEEAGSFAALGSEARYQDPQDRFLEVYASDLALEARHLQLRGGRRGAWQGWLDWTGIPAWRGDGAVTPFSRSPDGTLVLPVGWQPAFDTSGMTGLATALRPAPLETKRRTLELGGVFRPERSAWQVDIEARRDRKEGSRAFGGGVAQAYASQVPAPVDFTTDQVRLGLGWAGASGSFNAALSGSWFDNGQTALTWQNPFTPIAGTELLRAALAPSNQAWRIALSGAWAPRSDLRLSGRVGLGRASQDEPFLPYTSNSLYEQLPLPARSLAGQVEAFDLNAAGRLFARLAQGLDLDLEFRLVDRDNDTPVYTWTPVITDLLPRDETRNRPYSFRRERLSLDLRYRPGGGLSLAAGLRGEHFERSLQSVRETRESGAWAEAAFQAWDRLGLRARLVAEDRDAGAYTTQVDPGLPENPLMRKFNLADRQRRQAVLEAELPLDNGLSLALSWRHSRDRFTDSPLGLQSARDQGLTLDAGYALAHGPALSGFLAWQELQADIAGQENFTDDWRAATRDTFLSWGLGLDWPLRERARLRLDWFGSRSEGDIDTRAVMGSTPFPTLDSRLNNLRLRLDVESKGPWGWSAQLEHERRSGDDWQLDGLGADGIGAVLTLGAPSPGYSVTVLRLLGRYHF